MTEPLTPHPDDQLPNQAEADEAAVLEEALRNGQSFSTTTRASKRRLSTLQLLNAAFSTAQQPLVDDVPLSLEKIDRFEIVRRLGRGGFGQVFLAKDPKLQRDVAIKIPRQGVFADPGATQRMSREPMVMAGLRHPHIIPVFEAGTHDGLMFIVSEYCEGPTLDEWIDQEGGTIDAVTAAKIMLPLAEAVEYAHSQKVIHRDVKPANVLLQPPTDSTSELPFVPRLTDFGIARVEGESEELTGTNDILGTTAYMSPEQAQDARSVDGRSDIFSLGAVLYRMLTGVTPFGGRVAVETLARLRDGDPVRPSAFNKSIPRDLETICLKCLAHDPEKRYETARGLADDLQRFLEHKPILAKRTRSATRAVMWTRRNRSTAFAFGLVLLAMCSIPIVLQQISKQKELDRVKGLSESVLTVEMSQLPDLLEQLDSSEAFTNNLLPKPSSDDSEVFRVQLASLARDSRVIDEIAVGLEARTAEEVAVLTKVLRKSPKGSECGRRLLAQFDESSDHVLHCACVEAGVLDEQTIAAQNAADIVASLTRLAPHEATPWATLLRTARPALWPQLLQALRQSSSDETAVACLCELASDNPSELLEVLDLVDVGLLPRLWPQLAECENELGATLAAGSDGVNSDARINRTLAELIVIDNPERWAAVASSDKPKHQVPVTLNFARAGLSPDRFVPHLSNFDAPDLQFLSLLALSKYDLAKISEPALVKLTSLIEAVYERSPDRGVHSAAISLAARWEIDLPASQGTNETDWCEPIPGYPLVRFRSQQTYTADWIGLSTSDPRISASFDLVPFEIGTREVTKAQFESVMGSSLHNSSVGPDEACPINHLSYSDAARFCNRLSEIGGLPESEYCYSVADQVATPVAAFLTRRGFRLPMETEWEFAARGGADAHTYFGGPDQLVQFEFAPRKNQSQSVARLLPNRHGLFDCLGNAAEWVERQYDARNEGLGATKGGAFLLSTGWDYRGRSLHVRKFQGPMNGLRIARTLFLNKD